MAKYKVEGDTLTVEEGENDLVTQMIAGCQGTVIIKNPLIKGGKREIKKIKDKNGNIIKDKTKKDK